MPRSMFPEISTEETERSKNGKGFNGPGGEQIKNYVTSVRTPEGSARKSTWAGEDLHDVRLQQINFFDGRMSECGRQVQAN